MTRYVVVGAGAVGGVVGACLAGAGHDVTLVARGAHLEAIRSGGLVLRTPEGETTWHLPVVPDPRAARIADHDVVLLAVKSNDTDGVVAALSTSAPVDVHVVCLQNGVENERRALRSLPNVHAGTIVIPAAHLEPGVVVSYSSPRVGLLDIGRYPDGHDDVDERVASDFAGASFDARVRSDVMRWKWGKLVVNLGNAVEALCGAEAFGGALTRLARQEAYRCFAAAGIDAATAEEDANRRADLLVRQPVAGEHRPGSSTWQSLARGQGTVEVDWLNGEIALLGRLHGVPTPVNGLLQRLSNEAAAVGSPPGSFSEDELLAILET